MYGKTQMIKIEPLDFGLFPEIKVSCASAACLGVNHVYYIRVDMHLHMTNAISDCSVRVYACIIDEHFGSKIFLWVQLAVCLFRYLMVAYRGSHNIKLLLKMTGYV